MPLQSIRSCTASDIQQRTSFGAIQKRFPYRVIYEVIEAKRFVIIAAVLHALGTTVFGEEGCEYASACLSQFVVEASGADPVATAPRFCSESSR
jgi:hypothetical protein